MYGWWYPDWYNGRAYPARSAFSAGRSRESPPPGPDQRLERVVAAALLSTPDLRGAQIDLSVQNGVVVLEGQADSEAVRSAVVARTWSIPGVTDVCNVLAVRRRRFRRR